ncbi:MAG: peptidylprolyl isomerase [Candidatus Omnitrophota bacterium]
MLKVFRHKNVTKIVLWAILILILPAFVMWGAGSSGRSDKKGPTYTGLIEGKKISFEDFAQSIMSIRCQIILNYFNNAKVLEALLNNKPFIGKLAWDRLIMVKKARMARIKVSDQEVVNFIGTHPLFLRDGKFEDRAYEYFLRNSLGMYPRNFEELVRENLMIQKLTEQISKDVQVTDEEVLRSYEKLNSRFKISYIFISFASFADKSSISDEEAKNYYETHKQEFVIQKKEIKDKEAVTKVSSFDEVRSDIDSMLAEEKAKPVALDAANKAYGKLQDIINTGNSSFEDAAKKIGLKSQESKVFGRGDYIENVGDGDVVASAAAEMKKDEISKPLETKRGVLIFRVVSTEPFNEELFKKEKDDFTKNTLLIKKNSYVEEWLREQEKNAHLNIDLTDYDKYYQ